MIRNLPRPGYSNDRQIPQIYPPAQYLQNQNQSTMNGQQQQPQQQQQQPQQPQQQGNGQAGGSAAGSMDAQSQAASGGPNGVVGEMNLASVLHYLQSEWRRWERDRNEWEIERAEMRARIALLEGQRRSAENLKVDLLRRVKMLEYALRQERSRTFSTTGKASGIAPSRLIALQEDDKASSRDEKEGSGSEGSEEGSSDRPKANGNLNGTLAKASVISGRAVPDTSPWKAIGGVAKNDPKSRARSREYLKQCLQEITYLTSPGALNPLPARPPVTIDDNPSENGEPRSEHVYDRPTKTLPEAPAAEQPSSSALEDRPKRPLPSGLGKHPRPDKNPADDRPPGLASSSSSTLEPPTAPKHPQSHNMAIDATARPPSSPAVKTVGLPSDEPNGTITTRKSLGPARGSYVEASLRELEKQTSENAEKSGTNDSSESDEESSAESQLLTAIYRPDSKAAWREELRAANKKAERIRAAQKSGSEPSDEEQLASLSLSGEEDELSAEGSQTSDKVWTTRRTLKSHLDVVRTVAWDDRPAGLLVSAGDDNTVKVWATDLPSIMSKKPSALEIEPIKTYRGHTAPITTVTISSVQPVVFSASLDSTIRVWKLPALSDGLYAPYDPSLAVQTLEGHTDAVWDLLLIPGPAAANGKAEEDKRLVSCAADGLVKVWSYEGTKWSLTESWSLGEGDDVPTCLGIYNHDFGRVLVGFASGVVKVVNVETGAVVMQLGETKKDAQVNAVLSHPALPIVIVAHEDGYLRVYDSKTASATPTYEILAHPAAITSLSLSRLLPMVVMTASVDATVRVWDLNTQKSLQELGGHRKKSDEGVCSVASHPGLPIVASGGADGVVRLWLAM